MVEIRDSREETAEIKPQGWSFHQRRRLETQNGDRKGDWSEDSAIPHVLNIPDVLPLL